MIERNNCWWLLSLFFILYACDKETPSIPQNPPQVVPPVVVPPPEIPIQTNYYYPPLLHITTESSLPIDSKDYYLNATIKIESRDSMGLVAGEIFKGTTEIKGRGNSTWNEKKKPYRVKLSEKAEILGMPANKHWTLLANHFDKTLMRNTLAFEISRRMGFPYTPRSQFVDLELNGVSKGTYTITEHIRIDASRVNIPELKATATNISGGYLLEIDERYGEPFWFKTQKAEMVLCIKSPEDIPTAQLEYITNHVQKVEDILYGDTDANIIEELPKYLDLKSFVDYFLLNELAKNVDGNLRLSTFVYKNKDDDKLYFGPAWDYDLSFGNANYDSAQYTYGWITRYAPWYYKFLSQPEFATMVNERWIELRQTELTNFDSYIDDLSLKLEKSQQNNFACWPILNDWTWPVPQVAGSYKGEVSYLKSWLEARINWMDSQLK